MEFVLDMVHNNPGEPPFSTCFSDPATLAEYGYNGQVFKHWNCAADFSAFAPGVIPPESPDGRWIHALQQSIKRQIKAARAAGVKVYFHIDLFVLPRLLVQHYGAALCDDSGRISLDAPLTLAVHRAMFDELFSLFPETAGLIIRVGETYLFDTPYHVGNGPIRNAQYEASEESAPTEQRRYRRLIKFLREEICVRHGKYLFFRTWDCYPDKFHANLAYYHAVTDGIPPHEKLIFSVKHTALDFCRYVDQNPCLGQGKHRQIVEVQCQREYEGKGAYPNYVMNGVIDGFCEMPKDHGLRSLRENPLICGVFSWSRGGGWYGPYLQDELWCRLNAWVIAQWAQDPTRQEPDLFAEFFENRYALSKQEVPILRAITDKAALGILKGRYCGPYDRSLDGKIMPSNLWMRDDRLGGLAEVKPIFAYLVKTDQLALALQEKADAVLAWQQAAELARKISVPALRETVSLSCRYGVRLFDLVAAGWRLYARYFTHTLAEPAAKADFLAYSEARENYRRLEENPHAPTLYKGIYLNLPGSPEVPGMEESVLQCAQIAGLSVRP